MDHRQVKSPTQRSSNNQCILPSTTSCKLCSNVRVVLVLAPGRYVQHALYKPFSTVLNACVMILTHQVRIGSHAPRFWSLTLSTRENKPLFYTLLCGLVLTAQASCRTSLGLSQRLFLIKSRGQGYLMPLIVNLNSDFRSDISFSVSENFT